MKAFAYTGCLAVGFAIPSGCGSEPADGSSDAGAASSGGAAAKRCSSTKGGAMAFVEVQLEATGTVDAFCMDQTEVTRGAYAEFVATDPALPAGTVEACASDGDFEPRGSCLAEPEVCQGSDCARHPQVCVDVCDAIAFCSWAGKELCGPVGGGSLQARAGDQLPPLRWQAACGAGLDTQGQPRRMFSYGDQFESSRCANPKRTTEPVTSLASCVLEEEAQIHDLDGNVAELVAVLNPQVSGAVTTSACGADYSDDGRSTGCAALLFFGAEEALPTVGFRCCAAP